MKKRMRFNYVLMIGLIFFTGCKYKIMPSDFAGCLEITKDVVVITGQCNNIQVNLMKRDGDYWSYEMKICNKGEIVRIDKRAFYAIVVFFIGERDKECKLYEYLDGMEKQY